MDMRGIKNRRAILEAGQKNVLVCTPQVGQAMVRLNCLLSALNRRAQYALSGLLGGTRLANKRKIKKKIRTERRKETQGNKQTEQKKQRHKYHAAKWNDEGHIVLFFMVGPGFF